ncbi:MAG: cation-translocating P-type ATPase, partial [Minisyncoccia bacterium]
MEKKSLSFVDLTNKNIEDSLQLLQTSFNGLSQQEAEHRLSQFGFNELPSKKRGWIHVLLSQFKSPFTYLLFIAGATSFFIGEKIDAIFIFLFVAINVVLGFFQEYRAEKAIEVLKSFLPNEVKVIRDGKRVVIGKKYLVPGDIVVLSAGNIAPADLRIIEAKNLIVDESILTGESQIVNKNELTLSEPTKEIFEAKNIIFSGTTIINGEAKGVVISNIKESAVGKISKLVEEIKKKSVYEKELLDFSKLIIKSVLFFIVTVFVLRFLTNRDGIFDYLIFCIALIVSILPEALPTVVVFSLSRGALKLAKKKVVVKKLNAIESLGNIKILCSDKTGTLTENKMTLDETMGKEKNKILLFSLLSSELISRPQNIENVFDKAIIAKADKNLIEKSGEFKLITENPFDLKRLINSVIVENQAGEIFLITKGAPEKIFEKTNTVEGEFKIDDYQKKIKEVGERGKRVLALAYRRINKEELKQNINELENNFILLGLLIFVDPLKKTAREAIRKAEQLGVRVKLITGDSREVAGYIGYQIGLIKNPSEVIT